MRQPSRSNARAQQVSRNDSSSRSHEGTDAKRRRLLLALGAGGAGAVALGAASSAGAECNEPPPSGDDAAGYRVTQHVRDYYRTAKI
jgi:hypothetical protein